VPSLTRGACCSEFEEYRRTVAAAEVKDATDKRLASAEFRAALDLQVSLTAVFPRTAPRTLLSPTRLMRLLSML